MFELNGKQYTLIQVEAAASAANVSLDEYIEKVGLKTIEPGKITPVGMDAPAEVTKASDMVSSSANGFLEPQENLFENKAAQFVADKIGSLGAGTFALLEGVGDFLEIPVDIAAQKTISVYNYFADDDITENERAFFSQQIEDIFVLDEIFDAVENQFTKLQTVRDEKSILQRIEDKDYLTAIDQTISGLFQAAPSVVASLSGVGLAALGASSAGSHYEELSEANPTERGFKMGATALLQGGVELASEYVTRGIFKGAVKAFGGQTKQSVAKVGQLIAKNMFFEGASEVAAEEVNNSLDLLWDINKYYNQDGEFDGRMLLERTFDTFLISSLLGGATTGAAALTTNQKKQLHERLMHEDISKKVLQLDRNIVKLRSENKNQESSGVIFKENTRNIKVLEEAIETLKARVGTVYDTYTDQEVAEALSSKSEISELQAEIRNGNLSETQKADRNARIKQRNDKLENTFNEKYKALKENNILSIESLMGQLGFNTKIVFDTNIDAKGEFRGNGEIAINPKKADEVLDFAVAGHELLHPILNALVGDAQAQKKLRAEFEKQLTKKQRTWVQSQLDANVKPENHDTEYINYFADGLVRGEINYNNTVFDNLGIFFKSLFRKQGFKNIDFNTGRGIYNFLQEYSKGVKSGKFDERIAPLIKAREEEEKKKVAEVELVGDMPQESKTFTPEQDLALQEEVNIYKEKLAENKSLNEKFGKDIVTPQVQKAANVLKEKLDPLIQKIVANRTQALYDKIPAEQKRNVPRSDYELSLANNVFNLLNEYDGKQDLEKFLINRSFLRANSLATELGIEQQIKVPIDQTTEEGALTIQIESNYLDSTTMVDIRKAETERLDNLVDPTDILGELKATEYYAKASEKVAAGEFKGLTLASAVDVAPELTAELFGIKLNAYLGINAKGKPTSANFSGDKTKAQQLIYDNADKFISLLPSGAILETDAASKELAGTGVRIPRKLQQAFYEKQSRLSKGAGLDPFKLKDNITKEDFLATFGINKDGTFLPLGNGDARAISMIAFARLVGRLMTNTAARAEMSKRIESGEYTLEEIQNLAAGKSETQKSEFTAAEEAVFAMNPKDVLNEAVDANLQTYEATFNDIIEKSTNFTAEEKQKILSAPLNLTKNNKASGDQEFYIDELIKYRKRQVEILNLMPSIIGKSATLAKGFAGLHYRYGFQFKFEKSDKKSLINQDGSKVEIGDSRIETLNSLENTIALTNAAADNKTEIKLEKNGVTETLINLLKKQLRGRIKIPTISVTKNKNNKKALIQAGNNIEAYKNVLQQLMNDPDNLTRVTTYNALNSFLREYVHQEGISNEEKIDRIIFVKRIKAASANVVSGARGLVDVAGGIFNGDINADEKNYDFEHFPAMMINEAFAFANIALNKQVWIVPEVQYNDSVIQAEIDKQENALSGNKKTKLAAQNKVINSDKIITIDKSLNETNQRSDFSVIEEMIGRTSGIDSQSEISEKRATLLGKNKGKWKFFIPPSADDLMGLLYYMVGKGSQGDQDLAWIKQNIADPFAQGINDFTRHRQGVMNNFRELKKLLRGKKINLKAKNATGFTNETAVRVYIWATRGLEIPGLNREDVVELTRIVSEDSNLRNFAKQIMNLTAFAETPNVENNWDAGTLTTDILDYLNTSSREKFLEKYLTNIEGIFGKFGQDGKLTGLIANKLKAAYGENYLEALSDVLYRMKTGRRRVAGSNRLTNQFVNWINDSVGAIMFFNTRSALLQQLSFINFINFSDNNPLAASAAFTNQKQFWSDYSMLFNSDFLKERRSGLKTDVNADEIAKAAEEGRNPIRSVVASLLKKGFLPTQIADSHAIALGGASFYRNRVNRYLKEGKSQQEAEQQAFLDFQETTEESQQSSRPDRISMQQASPLGRLVLAFANTPMQYARLTKKAALDLINRRGDWKTNTSKLLYYGAVQNILFSTLQSALFALAFDDEEEEQVRNRYFRVGNSVADSFLRGLGFGGAAVATGKNMVLEAIRQQKSKRPDYERVALKALSLSPPIDSKLRKLMSAGRTFTYRNTREKMKTAGFSLDNPVFDATGQVISATLNLPADRVIRKLDNLSTPVRQDVETWQAISLALGYSKWDVGLIESQAKKPKPKTKGLKTKKLKTKKLK